MTPPEWHLALQRFVCGEMAEADERAFLAACEAAPDRWRAVALELAEWRAMKRLLGEHATPSPPLPLTPARPRRRSRWPVHAAAASLLFLAGTACGWLLPSLHTPPASDPGATAALSPAAGADGGGPAVGDAPLRLTFHQPGTADTESVPLPIYQPDEVQYPTEHPLARLNESNTPWGERLRQAGLEIEAVQTWYVVETDPGRVVLFPYYSAELRRVADRP